MNEENGDGHNHDVPPAQPPVEGLTAFLVVVNKDGKALAWSDINTPVTLERMASLDDMYGACAQVMRDVQILQSGPIIAQTVVNGQLQVAEQMRQQKFTQKLTEKGLRLPPH